MYHRLLLAAVLLSRCTGEPSVHGGPERVQAFSGGDAILPCSFNITDSDEFPTVEWSKEGLQPNVIHLYRDGCEVHEMKNPAFHYRTSLIMKELENRNISLRISNVQLSDAGKYQCMRLWGHATRDITTVELVVGAFPEPKLSVVSAQRGGVTLQCEANCWLLEPVINFLDDEGNNMSASHPTTNHNASGCYTVTRRVTLQNATNSVTCRVHQAKTNQTIDKMILIPGALELHDDYMTSCCLFTYITGGVTGLLLLCGVVVLVVKRCGRRAGGQKPPDHSTASGEKQVLLQSFGAGMVDNEANCTIESLRRQVAELKSKLEEREETIRQLQNNNKAQLSPVVCHLGQPTMVCSPATSTSSQPPQSGSLPQKQGPKCGFSRLNSHPSTQRLTPRSRIHSCPASFRDNAPESSSSSKKELRHGGRSSSDPYYWPGTQVPKLLRQHSTGLSSSILSNNRFKILAELTEESEREHKA